MSDGGGVAESLDRIADRLGDISDGIDQLVNMLVGIERRMLADRLHLRDACALDATVCGIPISDHVLVASHGERSNCPKCIATWG